MAGNYRVQEHGHHLEREYDPQGTAEVFDMASGSRAKASSLFPVIGPVSPDGRFMVSVDFVKGQVVVTDLSNDRVKWTFQQTRPSVIFSPHSQELAVAGGGPERRLTVLSAATGATISYVHDKPEPNDYTELTVLVFSADGKRIAAANYPEMSAKIWDVNAGRELREFAGQDSVQALAMSPDGKRLASASPGVTVRDPRREKSSQRLRSKMRTCFFSVRTGGGWQRTQAFFSGAWVTLWKCGTRERGRRSPVSNRHGILAETTRPRGLLSATNRRRAN